MSYPAATADSAPTPFTRRLVLGGAFLIGLALALAPRMPSVQAQEAKAPAAAAAAATKGESTSMPVTGTDGRGVRAKTELTDSRDPGAKGSATPGDSTDEEDSATANRGKSAPEGRAGHGVIIGKHGRIQIEGLGTDREFDSVGDIVHNEPAIAAMVIAIVTVVFLAPVLAIGLILWYRMRKARMLNETMLQLAERGVVTSADALEALAGGKQAAMLATAAASAPIYEQAKQIRRRAAWSDLRKGVLTGGVGLALTLYSWLEDREPNGLGLVLLFVGLGFVVLWWFEERQLAPATGGAGNPGPSIGASGTTPAGPPPSA